MRADVTVQNNPSADSNYFEADNLGRIADIDGHLDFLERISDKYILESQEQNRFISLLAATKRKQNDKLLNMSVIGEFSGGKSTFINALLRSELLSACSLQGTTVANTVIEYSDEYSIKLIYKEGSPEREKTGSLEELCNKVDAYTTDPEFTRKLNSVEIGLPSHNIKNAFRIIDTPGTNSLELWHEEVTKNALREISDISVILVDSTKVFPETLCNFVSENLEKILPQCAFVLTKFDLIPQKEQGMLLAYAKMKVENTFGLKDAFVLPFSSTAILEGDEENEMYKLSIESEKKLIEYMAKKKTVAQLKKVIYFADMLYDTAEKSINAASEETEQQLELLMKTKQTDLSSFINEQKLLRTGDYYKEAGVIEIDATHEIYDLATKARKSIIDRIEAKQTTNELKAYVTEKLSADCQSMMQVISNYANIRLRDVAQSAGAQVLVFQDEFKKKFDELQILDVDFSQYNEERSVYMSASANHMITTKKYVDDESKKQNVAFWGGAAAGAAIGTMAFPVIGTVIGGVIGFFTGKILSKNVSKLKQDTIQKLNPGLSSYVADSCNFIIDDFKKQVSRFSDSIESEIDNYYTEYKDFVDLKISEETNKKDEITNKIKSIKADMQEVKNRKHVLASVEKQIDMIGRKEEEL